MPSLFTSLATGPMMNRLRNSASPASTWFGGTFVRPSALRVMLRTTKILVKLVHSNRIAGATDITVINRMIEIDSLGLSGEPTLTVTAPSPSVDGPLGAARAAGGAAAAAPP